MDDFAGFCSVATGFEPYPYQRRLAAEGLPALLRAPTGSGKTVAAVLPWLYRRRFHPDPGVRRATPRWLVVALPLRTLVDQVADEVAKWLANLDLSDDVGLHVLMGGRGDANEWRKTPGRDAVVVGSIDMLLSRALNRGYAASRRSWPIDFGMFNNGTQWIFDEVQLLGPALATSRQLQALRERFGELLPTASMWMSATVDEDWLRTVDNPEITTTAGLGPEDLEFPALRARLQASKSVLHLPFDGGKPTAPQLAHAAVAAHQEGTGTLVFCNTVRLAQDVSAALEKSAAEPVALVHSRFRPPDRRAALDRALRITESGGFVVTTQALEAGVDISSRVTITQTAPWSSIIQRAGRCNRYGEHDDAQLLWFHDRTTGPYQEDDLLATAAALTELEGQRVTSGELTSRRVAETRSEPMVLRRKDLLELFDTTPDLSGNDIDVSPYIRETEDRDCFVAWFPFDRDPPSDLRVRQEDLCPVPIGDARRWLGREVRAWRSDHLTGAWTRVRAGDLRPGLVMVAQSGAGGYAPDVGWKLTIRGRVPEIDIDVGTDASEEDTSTDLGGEAQGWVTMQDHLDDAARETAALAEHLRLELDDPLVSAAVRAAALHDVGKAHPVFQESLLRLVDDQAATRAADLVWAKSSVSGRLRHSRRHFRHELVSALMLLTPSGRELLADHPEADLVRYLVAAHHGIVRLGVRPLDGENEEQAFTALGVRDGEALPNPVTVEGRMIDPAPLPVADVCRFGGPGSWSRLALELRDRTDLGPIQLGFLEALVRLGDWAASRNPGVLRDLDGEAVRS